MSLPIWCFTLMIHPFISGSSLVSKHLFLSKIIFKWYLEGLCFWASKFWSCDREQPLEKPDFKYRTKCAFVKVLWSFLDEKISLHLWQEISFLCNGEDTKFCFEWLITCPQIRKKGVKRLVGGRTASMKANRKN